MARWLGILAQLAALCAIAWLGGLRWAVVGLALAWVIKRLLLPRLAHGFFEAGHYRLSAVVYRVLEVTSFGRQSCVSARLSRLACVTGLWRWPRALSELQRLAPSLSGSARAVCANNIAYVLLRSGGDVDEAERQCRLALAERPEAPGFLHTWALVQLAKGQARGAALTLDGIRAEGLFEAERCYDAGRTWLALGEVPYADDYFGRCARIAPASRWAAAATQLRP